GQDQLAVERDAVILQRILVALVALRAGAVLAPAPQEADALVAELDQVFGDRVSRVAVVHVDAGVAILRVLARGDDADERNPGVAQRLDQRGLLGHRRRQHQPGQVRATHQRAQLLGQRRRGGIAGMDLQAEAAGAAHRQHAALQVDDVVRVRVVVDQADRIGTRAAQAARGGVGLVAERVDRLLHPLARARMHRGLVVDDARYRLQRDACPFRDILDGGAAHRWTSCIVSGAPAAPCADTAAQPLCGGVCILAYGPGTGERRDHGAARRWPTRWPASPKYRMYRQHGTISTVKASWK